MIPNALQSQCTFFLSGGTREFVKQAARTCRTCWPNDPNAAICYTCALYCHFDHDLTPVVQKEIFCDCGAERKCRNGNSVIKTTFVPNKMSNVCSRSENICGSTHETTGTNKSTFCFQQQQQQQQPFSFISFSENKFLPGGTGTTSCNFTSLTKKQNDGETSNTSEKDLFGLSGVPLTSTIVWSPLNVQDLFQFLRLSINDEKSHTAQVLESLSTVPYKDWYGFLKAHERSVQALNRSLIVKAPSTTPPSKQITDKVPNGLLSFQQSNNQLSVSAHMNMKLKWTHGFDQKKTTVRNGQAYMVSDQNDARTCRYYKDQQYCWIELDCKDDQCVVGFGLPIDHNIPVDPLLPIPAANLFQNTEFSLLVLPKMNLSITFNLKGNMLSCTRSQFYRPLFDVTSAWSLLFPNAWSLYIEKLTHEVQLQIDEHGSTCAAKSDALFSWGPAPTKREFIADRRVRFYIRSTISNENCLPLFVNGVYHPISLK